METGFAFSCFLRKTGHRAKSSKTKESARNGSKMGEIWGKKGRFLERNLGSILGSSGGRFLAAVRQLESAGRRGTIAAARFPARGGSFVLFLSLFLSLCLSSLSLFSLSQGFTVYVHGYLMWLFLSSLRGRPPYLATFMIYLFVLERNLVFFVIYCI